MHQFTLFYLTLLSQINKVWAYIFFTNTRVYSAVINCLNMNKIKLRKAFLVFDCNNNIDVFFHTEQINISHLSE